MPRANRRAFSGRIEQSMYALEHTGGRRRCVIYWQPEEQHVNQFKVITVLQYPLAQRQSRAPAPATTTATSNHITTIPPAVLLVLFCNLPRFPPWVPKCTLWAQPRSPLAASSWAYATRRRFPRIIFRYLQAQETVSYTHLTLPTIYSV